MTGIGLDFGTTNTTLAVYDGKTMTYVDIDTEDGGVVMPTANYMDREYTATIGTEALEEYLALNQGRQVVLEEMALGSIRVTHGESNMLRGREDQGGDTTVSLEVHARVDKNMPGLLLRGLKRRLGMGGIDTIDIFGVRYRVEALITPILAHVRKRLNHHMGCRASSIHVGRPVEFETDSSGGNWLAVEKLRRSCRYSGLPEPVFFPEPLGAALSFMIDMPSKSGSRFLVFDFGGGTLDLCVIRKRAHGFDIPATHGIPMGGDHINQLIYQTRIFPELGKGLMIRTARFDTEVTGDIFPFKKFEDALLNWQQTHALNREEYLETIDTALYQNRRDEIVIEKLTRLRELITWNYSYSVIKAIEEAKISLSHHTSAWIEVGELNLAVRITRAEFEKIITPILDRIDRAITSVLVKSGWVDGSVHCVVTTGGSSLIPAVQQILSHRFPGRVTGHSEFKSIAAGLAIAGYHGYQYTFG